MKCASHRCFTFMELSIAVTISMMIALALDAYSHGVTAAWAQFVNRRNDFNELLNLDRVVDKMLANPVPFTWNDRDNDNEEYNFVLAGHDRLRIAYMHGLHDEVEGALRFAELELRDGNLYIAYTDRPFREWAQIPEDQRFEALLAERIASIEFVYVDWNDDTDSDWGDRMLLLDEWETEESERMDIPLAIGLTVTWEDGQRETWFRRTMGNSYRERFGSWNPLDENYRK